ncbi:hypothetical protein QYE76_012989 [Lolium multiflorum]|uniref:E3 ubiquitin-protein ligase RMA n=1 Tax=Lolium multiflorum TaxID=4521 RepID=A0AAD8U094_LOLMU|nr:hypothetical protein QYE76_012989 [Lolium multiflorum]
MHVVYMLNYILIFFFNTSICVYWHLEYIFFFNTSTFLRDRWADGSPTTEPRGCCLGRVLGWVFAVGIEESGGIRQRKFQSKCAYISSLSLSSVGAGGGDGAGPGGGGAAGPKRRRRWRRLLPVLAAVRPRIRSINLRPGPPLGFVQSSVPAEAEKTSAIHMAGWADSGSSRGRGGGGGGFANRGGANNMNTRWRARTPPQHQQQQNEQQQHQQQQHHQHQQHQHHQHQQHQHHQHQQQQHYRPVNDNDQSSQHRHHLAAGGPYLGHHRRQRSFSTSTSHPQPAHPPQTHPTPTDHKSPAPATNAGANAIASEPDDKARRNAANFECNVCFDMADDPVVTKCGHLFCWECLYQWLHVHSHHRECPVCKGEVADDAIIPIYGRGGSAASVHTAPPRPTGARVESSRQQQQQAALDWHMAHDDEDGNPMDDLQRLFGVSFLRDAMMSLMPGDDTDMEDYTNPYHHPDLFDDHYNVTDFQSFVAAGAGPSRGHGRHDVSADDIIGTFFDYTTPQEPGFAYRGGRRQRGRARGAASADHSGFAEMMGSSWSMGGSSSSASYRDTGASGPHVNTNAGGSSRPNGGWTERRGRSNRNSYSGGGREDAEQQETRNRATFALVPT